MENKTYFRSTVVGGYNKEDVHRCIQELKKVSEDELITSEEIIGELNVQIEEQKNEIESILEEQKLEIESQRKRYEDMLENQKEEYEARMASRIRELTAQLENQKDQLERNLSSNSYEATAAMEESNATALELKKQCDIWCDKYETLNVKTEKLSGKIEELNIKNKELNNQNDSLTKQYNEIIRDNERSQADLRLLSEKKDLLFKYEIDARERADKIVHDAQLEAERIRKEADRKAVDMVQNSKGRIDYSMRNYIKLCDDYRMQTHASALAALKLQRQLESVVMQVVEGNNEIKQKVAELYNSTEKGIDFFDED